MDISKRSLLEKKRKELQIKLDAEEYIRRYVVPITEIFDYFDTVKVRYAIAGFVSIPPEYHPHVGVLLTQVPFDGYGFRAEHLKRSHLKTLIDTVFDKFPSVNELRYVPDLPEHARYEEIQREGEGSQGLKKVLQALELQDQKVYIYYLNYCLLLQASLVSLSIHEHSDLFNMWHGDVMIFPEDMEWLIAFTLEEEWLGGRKGES